MIMGASGFLLLLYVIFQGNKIDNDNNNNNET